MIFSKVRWFIAALIGSTMCLCAQQNILPDPGFEAPESDGPLTDGWWVYNNRGEAHASVDKKVAHSGNNRSALKARRMRSLSFSAHDCRLPARMKFLSVAGYDSISNRIPTGRLSA